VALVPLLLLVGAGLIPLQPLTENPAGERIRYHTEVYQLDSRWVADAGPRSRHVTNGQGLRGDPIVGRDLELLTLGGSTLECGLLEEPDALTARIAAGVNEQVEATFRAAALAQGGLPLQGLMPEFEAFTAGKRRPDVVVGMFGANEAQMFFNHAPWLAPSEGAPWEVWLDPDSPFGLRGRGDTYRGWYLTGNQGSFLEAPRSAYADQTHWTHDLHPEHVEPFKDALNHYFASLIRLEKLARERGAQLVLVTQPVAPAAPPSGGRGWAPFLYSHDGKGFLPSPALTRNLVGAFNVQSRAFAAQNGLPLVDLEKSLDGCWDCFYDQWHFSDTGAARAGAEIASTVVPLLALAPTTQSGRHPR